MKPSEDKEARLIKEEMDKYIEDLDVDTLFRYTGGDKPPIWELPAQAQLEKLERLGYRMVKE